MAYGGLPSFDEYAKRYGQQPSKLYSVTSRVPGMPKDGLGLFPTNAQVAEAGRIISEPAPRTRTPAATAGTTSFEEAATQEADTPGEIDPWIAFLLQQQQAQRALALQFAQNQANASLQQSGQSLISDRAAMEEQYNRAYPTMPTQFLQRGMGTSGIANAGIQRFQQDYVSARQKLEDEYQNARAQILAKLAESQVTYGTGTVGDLLGVFDSYAPTNG